MLTVCLSIQRVCVMALSFIGAAWINGRNNAIEAMELFGLLPGCSGETWDRLIEGLGPLPWMPGEEFRGDQSSGRGKMRCQVLIKQALLSKNHFLDPALVRYIASTPCQTLFAH